MKTPIDKIITAYKLDGLPSQHTNRLYVSHIRGRKVIMEGRELMQTAYIDMVSYTPHCMTYSGTLSPHARLEHSQRTADLLRPLARLLRYCGAYIPGAKVVDMTPQRALYQRLMEAGMAVVIEEDKVLLDMKQLTALAGTSWLPVKDSFSVHYEGVDNAIWRTDCKTRETALKVLNARVVVQHDGEYPHASEVTKKLAGAANLLLQSVTKR